jgi:hypothetical protein
VLVGGEDRTGVNRAGADGARCRTGGGAGAGGALGGLKLKRGTKKDWSDRRFLVMFAWWNVATVDVGRLLQLFTAEIRVV